MFLSRSKDIPESAKGEDNRNLAKLPLWWVNLSYVSKDMTTTAFFPRRVTN
jgi:hypothetical protein